MKQLWAPWRSVYFDAPKDGECIFCAAHRGTLDYGQVLYAGAASVVMLNKYPYNSGHLLIAPVSHTGRVEDLTDAEGADTHRLLRLCVSILTSAFTPQGFNIGMNVGHAAGAGIVDHLHTHVVPRWNGDCNFMPVLSEVRVMPEHLEATYKKLKPFFDKI